jgi:TPP-dependent pyruvate/acetoin dehydrogenase alpha subunit
LAGPSAEPSRERLLDLYRVMVTIRRFEEVACQLLVEGKIPASLHASIGQEAVATGLCGAPEPPDFIVSNHRGHGHCIAKGVDVRLMMAELEGKASGTNRGRGGSMHIADPDLGILGANGIVGGGVAIAAGGDTPAPCAGKAGSLPSSLATAPRIRAGATRRCTSRRCHVPGLTVVPTQPTPRGY